MRYRRTYPSPLGAIGLVCDDKALLALWLPGQKPFPEPATETAHPILEQAENWLARYFAGERVSANELPLNPQGSPFRQVIWKLLLEIPYGQLAQRAAALLGKPRMSAQAVGGAVGANPIAIVIPCHRCLGADGRLTGYAGGLHYKKFLLDLEGILYRQSRSWSS